MKDLDIKIIECVSTRGAGVLEYALRVNKPEGRFKQYRIFLAKGLVETLGLRHESQVLFGRVGQRFYIATKPDNIPAKAYTARAIQSGRTPLVIANRNLHTMMTPGEYDLGDPVMKSGILWYELVYKN